MKCLEIDELKEFIGTKKMVTWHPDYNFIHRSYKDVNYLVKNITVFHGNYSVYLEEENGYTVNKIVDSQGYGVDSRKPVFIMADLGLEVETQPYFTKEALKKANSRPSATTCAKCGGPLKEPVMNIKYCPVCEP